MVGVLPWTVYYAFLRWWDGAMRWRLVRLFTISPTLHRSVCASFNLFNFLLLNQALRFAVVAIFKNGGGLCGGPGRRAGSGASNCRHSGGANQQCHGFRCSGAAKRRAGGGLADDAALQRQADYEMCRCLADMKVTFPVVGGNVAASEWGPVAPRGWGGGVRERNNTDAL